MSGLSADRRGAPPESSPPAPGGLAPDRAAATGAGPAGAFARLRPALFRAAACLVVAVAALLALPGGVSAQENPVRQSWSLTPSGLSVGDKFRLIFVTSTQRNASPSNIGVYNTFVQNRAAAGHAAIQAYSSQFRVVGSTAAVDARDNTGTTGTGVPIYWLNGNKVADNYADFYDGSWSNEASPTRENGNALTTGVVNTIQIYTGSQNNGTESFESGSSRALGGSRVRIGLLDRSSGDPLSAATATPGTSARFYALSPVFTVKAPPAITDVSVTSRPADGTDTFGGGERVEVTVTFDEAVEVQNSGINGANVSLRISLGDTSTFITWQANFLRMDHPRKLVFGLTVTSSHEDDDGLCIGASCGGADTIRLSGGGAIVAAEDGVAAVRNYDGVLTSWNVDGSSQGLTGGVCDRHPAVRAAIVLAVSAASTCADVTDAHLAAIRALDLSGEGIGSGEDIGSLRKADFEGLTGLAELDLSDNALDHLPGDLFEHLDFSMRTLKLDGNPLGAFPAGVFDPLTGLKTLDLSNTGLTELPAGLFAELDRLEVLQLVENRLRAFPAAALADVAGTLQWLILRSNDIASIDAGALDGMTELLRLELQNNALASLPDDLLRPLTKLEIVELYGNPGFNGFAPVVEAIPEQSFERRQWGQRVDLEAVLGASPWGDNVIWTWPQIGSSVTLNDADTATPWFTAPAVDADTRFTFTATATGRGTRGAGLSKGARTARVTVQGPASIADVSVTSRPADGSETFKRGDRIEVTVTFSEPVHVTVGGGIGIGLRIGADIIDGEFHRQDHPNKLVFRHIVVEADIENSGIVIGNDPETPFGTGEDDITLTAASIRAVADGTNARVDFDVQQTPWEVDGSTEAPTGGICGHGYHPKVLAAILDAVPGGNTSCDRVTDADLAAIASLDLSGEAIDSLHKRDFEGLTGLTELNLSDNALDRLPDDLFEHVATLTGLRLRDNDIAALPAGVFDGLTALKTLDLRDNDIAALPAGVFDNLTGLWILRLSNNALASLPDNVFAPLTQLRDGGLLIDGNPGFEDFVPRVTVSVPAQTVRPGVRVDLEAIVEPNPWGSNLVWSWTRTDTGGETVTLEDDDTRTAYFVAPDVDAETALAFEVTATGRGTAGVASPSKATEAAAVTVEDIVPPVPASARVEASGDEVVLTFNEDLDIGPGKLPPASAFTVEADGAEVTVQSVAEGSGADNFILQLPAGAITDNHTVTVSYAVPAANPIRDVAGNEAKAFPGFEVTNNSTVDGTPPELASGEVGARGNELTLTFNEDLDIGPGKHPPADAFIVKADGDEVGVQFVEILVDLDHFLLTLSSTIGQGQIVTVSYAVPTTGTVIADVAGNAALAFTDERAVNNSTVANTTPPVLASAEVGARGTSLTLTFNEDLDIGPDKRPPASAFTVEVDGDEVAVQSVDLLTDQDHFLLTLSSTITDNHTVTVSYAVPGTNPIRDTDGNEAKAFTDEPVTNNSTLDGTPPELASGEVNSRGTSLTLTFNEDLDFSGGGPLTNRFIVHVDNGPVALSQVNIEGTDGVSLILAGDAIQARQVVTVNYLEQLSLAGGGPRIVDLAGNRASTFYSAPVANNSTVGNTEPPVLVSARVTGDGGDIHLTFNKDIAFSGGVVPPASAFTVEADGAEVTVRGASKSGINEAAVLVALHDKAIKQGQTVTVSYTVPATGAVQDTDDNAAKAFTDEPVTNNSTVDVTPPVPESAVVRGTGGTLAVTFNEDLDIAAVPLPSAFTVKADGVEVLVQAVLATVLDTLALRLSAKIRQGQTVTVSYAVPTTNPIQDAAGNPAVAFTDFEVTNNSTVERTPPIPASAEVLLGGSSLALTFNENLDVAPGRVPPASAFTVKADGVEVPVQSVAVSTGTSFDTLFLSLSSTIGARQIVTVSYAVPNDSDDRIADVVGNEAVAFEDFPATNNSTVANTTPPVPASAEVPASGLTLTLTFNENLDIGPGKLPPASAFTVKADGVEVTVQAVALGLNRGNFNLSLSPTIKQGQTVTVSYAVPESGTVIEDTAGNDALAFDDFEVDNNSTVDGTPPIPESGEVGAQGNELTLTFNEDLDIGPGKRPPADAFTVKADGVEVTVQAVELLTDLDHFLLTLSSTIKQGQTVTVSYAVPDTGTVIEDTAGNDALAFDDFEVDNNSTVDGTPPIPESGEVGAQGNELTLTFNEDLDIGPGKRPPADAFTVKADGVEVTVQAVELLLHLDHFLLTLSSTIKQGQTVTVSYAVPESGTVIEDTAGNDALAFDDFEVDNNSTVDGTPPIPESGEVGAQGNELTLTFNEDLDIGPGKRPPADAFTVKADGVEVTVQAVELLLHLDHFLLTLSSTIKQGQTVTVSYAVPESGTVIEDTAGNDALAFDDFEVDNNSTVEGTPPVPASAEVLLGGTALSITFNEELDNGPGKLPPADAFTVKADGVEVTAQSVEAVTTERLSLTLSSTIKQGQTVTVSYEVPDTGTVIADVAGNRAEDFTDFEVTNNSTADGAPPIPASAEVGASGETLILTFNEDLDLTAIPFRRAFTVKADGVEVPGGSVFTLPQASDQLALELSDPIGARQIVTVSYAVPTIGGVIEDLAGNDAVAFEDFPVTNNSTVDNTTPPVPASGEVPASGASLTLTFNEDLDNGPDKLPPATAFSVTAGGVDVPVQSVSAGSGADSFILDLGADAINQCQTVTVDYVAPTTNPIRDTDGNPALGFTGFPVTNNSTVECPNLNPPVFGGDDPRMFSVEENVPLGTDIGEPVTATDADRDTLTYSVDTASRYASYFQINSETGQLQTNVANGRVFNHENDPNEYDIIVVADDGRGRTAQITVAVSVTDLLEPPDAPGAVTVTGSGTTSLEVTWTAPENAGRPDIEDYDVQYREAGASQWTNGPQDVDVTRATIMPVDPGKSYEVQVRATNDEGDGPWAVWGATITPVTIEAEHEEIGAGLEDLKFTLTRAGVTTDVLVATVTIAQEQSWLGNSDLRQEVAFLPGYATTELTIAASKFSFAPTASGDLTATVSGAGIFGGSDTVEVVSTAEPPITVGLDMSAYSFAEDDPAEDVAVYVVAKLHPDYPRPPARARDFGVAVSTGSGTATFREDYISISKVVDFLADDYELVGDRYVARKVFPEFAMVSDNVYEGTEGLVVKLERSANLNTELVNLENPDGTLGLGAQYPVTITDEGDVPVLSLSVDPSSIAEEDDTATTAVAENVSTVTVGITNGKTFAVDRTVTLIFSGGIQGTHYSVSPGDADTNTAGHQVVFPAGESSLPPVTVTAAANDSFGILTVTVTGDLDGTAFGTRKITILDDETMGANIPAEGVAGIGGTPQVGHELSAEKGSIDDANDLPTTDFPLRYSFQWVRVAAGGAETNVGTDSYRYSPIPSDAGSRIKVEVSFIDGAGNPETVPSAPVGPVLPAAGACIAGYDWCAAMTVGIAEGSFVTTGYNNRGQGRLDDTIIDYGSKSFPVVTLQVSTEGRGFVEFQSSNAVEFLPRGSVFDFGGTEFTAERESERSTAGRYRWGIPAGFGWIEDQKVTVSANLAPAPDSGTVDGTTLVLTHAEDLDTGSTPAPGAYTVNVDDGAGPAVSSVSVGARTVTLTLTPVDAFTAGQTVTVTYTPGSSPLRDVSGLDAPAFEGFEVTNDSPVDESPPIPVSGEVSASGNKLTLTFNEDLDIGPGKLPPASAFTVEADGAPVTVQSVGEGTGPDNFVLSLSPVITKDRTVTVGYIVPDTGLRIADTAGNEAVAFDFEVTNNSTVVDPRGAVLTPPALTVDEGTTGSYTVELTAAPTGTVTVLVTVEGAGVTLSRRNLPFTTSNWNVKQTVNVTAGEDANAVDETVTLTHTVSRGGGYDDVVLPDLGVTVADNDGGIVADPTALTVAEGGTGAYGLKLTRAPTSDVTVTVLGAGGAVTAGPATLTFTADTWDTAQTVTVTGKQDGDGNDETATLRHAATGGGYAVAAGDALSARVVVTVEDDEATAPGEPGLEAAAGNESVMLRWTPPGNDGGAPVTGYKYMRIGGDPPEEVGAEVRRATVGGLVNHTEYTFQVWAVNRVGEGAESEAKATPIPLTLTVEAVKDTVTEGEPVRYRIRMSRRTPGAVVESLYSYEGDFVRDSNSSVVAGINSKLASDDGLSWVVSYDTVDDAAVEKDGSFTVTIRRPAVIRLSNGEDFDQYSHGQGYAVGSPATATVKILDNDGGAPPKAPPRPTVTVVSPTMLDAAWGPAPENGAPVTGYILEYRAGSLGQWTRWPEAIAPDARAVRLTGLAPGTDYEVQVQAKSVRGPGPWSAVRSAKTAPDPGVTVSVSVEKASSQIEGATLVFTVRANPAQASALRVDLRVTETLEMLSGQPPASVTVPAGQRSATFEVRTRDDREDEGYSEVTAELLPSVRYLLGAAREAMYRVLDDEPDTVRGAVENPRVEAILDPAWSPEEQALFEKPIRRLRFTWDPPTDVALAHVRGWGIHSHEVDSCSDPAPDPEDLENNKWKGRAFQVTADTVYSIRAPGAMYFTVQALLLGGAPSGPWSEPMCGDVAEPGSARGGASEPVVTAARIASGADGAWSEGDAVEAVVRFSEAVTVDTSGGTPSLAIVLGDAGRAAVYAGGTGTTELVFRHEVGDADDGARGARVVAGGLALNGATIRNAAGVDAELGFALAPVVTSVAVEPDPDGDGVWSPDEAVTVTFGFSDAVTVRTEDGTPSVSLHAGGAREAAYAGGSGTATLRFAYTVTAADGPVASVLVLENGLGLHGGGIVGPTGLAAALAHAGVGRSGTPTVRGTPALSVADASAPEGGTLAFAVTLAPAAPGAVSVDWATSDGTAKAGSDYTAASGSLVFAPGETSKTVSVAVLADEEAEGAETMVLTLSNASGAGLADAKATGTVSDPAEVAPAGPPPAVSIADATVDEGPGAVLAFAVTLDRASQARATVDWETRDGNARAGDDYVAGSGTLRFAPGETAKTIQVAVLDDSHDEGREVMLVVLSNPVGATIAKAAAGGTIENTDHMPQAWLGRFGRTVAEQVLEAVEERIRAAPQAGVQVTVAGQRIGAAAAASEEEARETEAQTRLEDFSTWLRGEACRDDPGTGGDCPARTGSRAVTPRDLLTGTSFALTTGAEGIGGGLVSLWGRGALTRFDGREDELSLSGEVTGAMLGADWTRERSTLGLMLSHARGEGSYRGKEDSGKVSSTVTGLYPYGRYALTDRVTLWGAAGYGAGTLTLTPDGKSTYETDMDLAMAAAGLRGVVVEAPPEGGPELAVKTDAMAVRTSSEATEDSAGGNLAAATADVTRLRLGLEGTWRGLEIGTGTLEPRLEIGVRHDGGDAETGFGLDLGGGLAWSDPGTGIRAEVSGRGLLTHESAGFRERGIAGSFGWDPTPGSDRGPSLTLSQTMGLSAQGGADALLGRTTLAGLAANDNGDEFQRRRLELKLGYGFGAFGDRFTSTPEAGFAMSEGRREYSLGWRLVRDRRRGDIGSLEFALEARREESANDNTPPEHTVGLRITARW